MKEMWDLYDENRNLTGELHQRGLKVPQNRYHIVTDIWTLNSHGEILIDQRHPDKPMGLHWECTGGSALAGEDSITSALREIHEEIGLELQKEDLELINTICLEDRFVDTYVTIQDITLEDLTLQKEEVVDARFVSYDELIALWDGGKGNLCPRERFSLYQDELRKKSEELQKK